MTSSSQLSSKKFYLIIGVALVLLFVAIISTQTFNLKEISNFLEKKNHTNKASGEQALSSALSVSEQAEVVNIGDKQGGIYREIIIDPFVVDRNTTQQLIVKINSSPQDVRVKLKDGRGIKEKPMRIGTYQDEKVYYYSWQPKKMAPDYKYPVTFLVTTSNGGQHKLTLKWRAE